MVPTLTSLHLTLRQESNGAMNITMHPKLSMKHFLIILTRMTPTSGFNNKRTPCDNRQDGERCEKFVVDTKSTRGALPARVFNLGLSRGGNGRTSHCARVADNQCETC
eukprot:3840754-Amphidinium_carterae.1